MLIWAFSPLAVAGDDEGRIGGADWESRSRALTRWLAENEPRRPLEPKDAMAHYTARLQTGIRAAGAVEAMGAMVEAARRSRPDPFELHAVMHGYSVVRDQIPPELAGRFREFLASEDYTQSIGVSLNYMLMRDAAGWLAAQEWPDLVDRGGNPAARIRELCRARLMRQMRETVEGNASEYAAPLYLGTDFMPLRMLAEFAADEELRRASRMTLECLLIHTGAHWQRGYFIAAAARAKYWGSADTGPDKVGATTGMAYLLFGGDRPQRLGSNPAVYWMAHPGIVLPMPWLSAWQAALPASRTVRSGMQRGGGRKRSNGMALFMPGYGLASETSDGIGAGDYHYKELRRTMLKWISDHPSSTFTVLQENRRRPHERIANAFAYGENPHARVFQHEGTILGIHRVPGDYGFWTLRAPFTRRGAILQRMEQGGWIACHGGTVLFAFRTAVPGRWEAPNEREGLDLYRSDEPVNAWVLDTAPASDYPGDADTALRLFLRDLGAHERMKSDLRAGLPWVSYQTRTGRSLRLVWGPPGESGTGARFLDDSPLPASQPVLLETHRVRHQSDTGLTVDLSPSSRRTYDFRRWHVE